MSSKITSVRILIKKKKKTPQINVYEIQYHSEITI